MTIDLPIPPIPDNRTYTGTLTNTTTGDSYDYTAKPGGSFSSGYAQGRAMAAASRASRNAKYGRTLAHWADGYWLRDSEIVPASTGVSGALLFRSGKKPTLPLRLEVTVGDETFEFQTSTK